MQFSASKYDPNNDTHLPTHIITPSEAYLLIATEDEDLAPGEPATKEEEIKKFADKITGMTLLEYSKWRWPDEYEKQLKWGINVLKMQNDNKAN